MLLAARRRSEPLFGRREELAHKQEMTNLMPVAWPAGLGLRPGVQALTERLRGYCGIEVALILHEEQPVLGDRVDERVRGVSKGFFQLAAAPARDRPG